MGVCLCVHGVSLARRRICGGGAKANTGSRGEMKKRKVVRGNKDRPRKRDIIITV